MPYDQAVQWIGAYLSNAADEGRRMITFGEIGRKLPEKMLESLGSDFTQVVRKTAEEMGFVVDPTVAGFTEVGFGQSITYAVRIDPK